MREAYREALKAFDEDEVPIGAVVVQNNVIIGRGHNRVEGLRDPTAHAEIIAISAACNTIGDWRLADSAIFVTVEPCLMCIGAIINARIEKVVYGIREPKFGALGSVLNILEYKNFNHTLKVEKSNIFDEEITALMKRFFESKRNRTHSVGNAS
ncbi:MAG: tRNA-specific adenosine deaminase [Candidatus Cloacimonas sp. 4484_209]|nr:MAG: tRNA-specific adenosine deaminase [Candidatus Cloacimonas sp. 4484_209]